MLIGKRLKELRESKELSQEDLGKLVNLSQQTIGHYEVDRAEPKSETLNILADYFHVSVDYLLGRSDIKRNPTRQEIAAFMTAKKTTGIELGPSLLSQVEDEKKEMDFNTRISNLSDERQQTLERVLRSLETEEKIEKEKVGTD
jgi:transcriptional regulator with XRE-family HTH domain